MSTTQPITTAEQLLTAHDLGRCELLRGELMMMMSPAGFEHGRIVSRLNSCLEQFVTREQIGAVTGAETGFRIERNPDTVRAPDIGFIRSERVPEEPVTGFFPGAPDLAVEVLSPNDRSAEVTAKVADWLRSGALSVWVVDPAVKTVALHRPEVNVVVLSATQRLTDDELLPGFAMPVADIFAR